MGHGQPGSLDSAIDPAIMNDWHHSALGHGLSQLGALGPVALMALALVVACIATRRWSGAVLAVVAAPAKMQMSARPGRFNPGDPAISHSGNDQSSGQSPEVTKQ